MRVLFKAADKPAHAHAAVRSVSFDIDVLIVMFVKILHGQFHLRVEIFVSPPRISGEFPVNPDKQMAKQ